MLKVKKMNDRNMGVFDDAVGGLQEYYPELRKAEVVNSIRAKVTVPDTGNTQRDYESVRDQVERFVQDILIDGRVLGEDR